MADVILPHTFIDGPGNTASGEQVMDNLEALKAAVESGLFGSAQLAPTVVLKTSSGGVATPSNVWTDMPGVTETFTPDAAGVSIVAAHVIGYSSVSHAGPEQNTEMRLMVDGVAQAYVPLAKPWQAGQVGDLAQLPFTLIGFWLPVLTAAAHTIKVQVNETSSQTCSFTSGQMLRFELGA